MRPFVGVVVRFGAGLAHAAAWPGDTLAATVVQFVAVRAPSGASA